MDKFRPGKLTASSPAILARELTLAADRSLWAGRQTERIAVTARIYDLFDVLEMGVEPDVHSYILAAETSAWIGGGSPYVEFLSSAHAPS